MNARAGYLAMMCRTLLSLSPNVTNVSDAPVVFKETKADSYKRKHEIQTEEMSVFELLAASRQAESHEVLALLARRCHTSRAHDAEDVRKSRHAGLEIELDVQEVVERY